MTCVHLAEYFSKATWEWMKSWSLWKNLGEWDGSWWGKLRDTLAACFNAEEVPEVNARLGCPCLCREHGLREPGTGRVWIPTPPSHSYTVHRHSIQSFAEHRRCSITRIVHWQSLLCNECGRHCNGTVECLSGSAHWFANQGRQRDEHVNQVRCNIYM